MRRPRSVLAPPDRCVLRPGASFVRPALVDDDIEGALVGTRDRLGFLVGSGQNRHTGQIGDVTCSLRAGKISQTDAVQLKFQSTNSTGSADCCGAHGALTSRRCAGSGVVVVSPASSILWDTVVRRRPPCTPDDLQAGDPRSPLTVHERDVLPARLRSMPCGT